MRTKVAAWDGEIRLLVLSAAATTCLYGVLVALGVFPSVLGVHGAASADAPSVRIGLAPVHHRLAKKANTRRTHIALAVAQRRGPWRAKVGTVTHIQGAPAGRQPPPTRPNTPTTPPSAGPIAPNPRPAAPTAQPAAAPPAAPIPPTPVSTTVTLTTLPAPTPTPTPPQPPPTVVQAPPPPPPPPPLISLPPLPLPQLPLQLPGQ